VLSFVKRVARILLPLLTIAVALSSCGDDPDGGPREPPLRPAASCPVVIEAPAFLETKHVPEGTAIDYNSNPPCSGAHYSVWAAFQEYDKPIDRPYLVHDMEHGAIVLLYNCALAKPNAPCDALKDGLRKVRDALPPDPSCDPATRVRVVIAPDPKLDVPVAAAAWGYTYKGDCVDEPTLTKFAKDHYAKGPEDLCVAGRVF
jgi:hypothetical protein